MRALLVLVCALLFICSAAPPSYTKIICAGQIGHGTRIGGGLVLGPGHALDTWHAGDPIYVDKRKAVIEARGADKILSSEDPADDGCDWLLLRCWAYGNDPAVRTARAAVGGNYWYWGYNKRQSITVVQVGDNVAGFTGCYVKDGESGTGVFTQNGTLVGIITSGVEPCTSGRCPLPAPNEPTGWFCMISPEIASAIEAAQ